MAAARHFVARRTPQHFPGLTSLSGSLGVLASSITINFVGVFDTVSSYGKQSRMGTVGQFWNNVVLDSFSNDVDELGLAMRGVPVRAVQLAAADEYRKQFARTTITTSVQAGKGFECTLPGVHSDVGGSYVDGEEESQIVDAYERDRLVDEGWYTSTELIPLKPGMRARVNRTISHDYQFIPLSIMMQLAQKYGVTFKPFTDKFAAYTVPARLRPLSALMHRYVVGRHDSAPGQPANYELPDTYKWVRHDYLRRSTSKETSLTGIAMAPRERNGRPDRQVIPDQPRR